MFCVCRLNGATYVITSGELIVKIGIDVNAKAARADLSAILVPQSVGRVRVNVAICGG
jgi:hypothetical protein